MDPEVDNEIINEICEYSEKYEIKQLLHAYLKRLIIEKPENPLEYLVNQIQENPYEIKAVVKHPVPPVVTTQKAESHHHSAGVASARTIQSESISTTGTTISDTS